MSDRESALNFVTASPLAPAACAVDFVPCAAVPSLGVLCRVAVSVVVRDNTGRVNRSRFQPQQLAKSFLHEPRAVSLSLRVGVENKLLDELERNSL